MKDETIIKIKHLSKKLLASVIAIVFVFGWVFLQPPVEVLGGEFISANLSVFEEGFGRGRRYGLQDPAGNIVVPAVYHRIMRAEHREMEPTEDGGMRVSPIVSHYVWRVQLGDSVSNINDIMPKIGLYDAHGNELVPAVFEVLSNCSGLFAHGAVLVGMGSTDERSISSVEGSLRYGIYNIFSRQLVVPIIYERISFGYNRLIDGTYSSLFRVSNGETRSEEYKERMAAEYEWYTIRENQLFGLVNGVTGELIVPINHRQDDIRITFGNMVALGDVVGAKRYTEQVWYHPEVAWSLIDESGNVVIESSTENTMDTMFDASRILANGDYITTNIPNELSQDDWRTIRRNSAINRPMRVYHYETGTTFNVRSISNGNHADVVPATAEDYRLFRTIFDNPHVSLAVWVTVGNYVHPAAFWRGQSAGYNHYCLHFIGSTNNNNGNAPHSGTVNTANRMAPILRQLQERREAEPAPVQIQIPISVTVDGRRVNFESQPPVNVDGRVLVPVRGVFEALGFDVSWNPDTRQATLARASDVIIITIDSVTFTTNGINHTLDVPAQIFNGSIMLPIRAVIESVGYNLDWEGETQTVVIT